MKKSQAIARAIYEAELALASCHNCIATDRADAKPDRYSWRIDNRKEVEALSEITKLFFRDRGKGICPLCYARSSRRRKRRKRTF